MIAVTIEGMSPALSQIILEIWIWGYSVDTDKTGSGDKEAKAT